MKTATYHTNDPREMVDHWYAQHLGPDFLRHDAAKPVPEALRQMYVPANDITFVGERGSQVRVVDLGEDSTGTKITLQRGANPNPKPAATQAAPPQPVASEPSAASTPSETQPQ